MTESSNIQSNSENLESNQPEDSGLKESVETHNDEIQKRNQIEDLKKIELTNLYEAEQSKLDLQSSHFLDLPSEGLFDTGDDRSDTS